MWVRKSGDKQGVVGNIENQSVPYLMCKVSSLIQTDFLCGISEMHRHVYICICVYFSLTTGLVGLSVVLNIFFMRRNFLNCPLIYIFLILGEYVSSILFFFQTCRYVVMPEFNYMLIIIFIKYCVRIAHVRFWMALYVLYRLKYDTMALTLQTEMSEFGWHWCQNDNFWCSQQ